MATKTPIDPQDFAEDLVQLPAAGDRVRLVALDYAMDRQGGRVGATMRSLALTRARRPTDSAAIARLETSLEVEQRIAGAYGTAVQKGEIDIPSRDDELFVIHGRVTDPNGAPAEKLTVSAIDPDGRFLPFS